MRGKILVIFAAASLVIITCFSVVFAGKCACYGTGASVEPGGEEHHCEFSMTGPSGSPNCSAYDRCDDDLASPSQGVRCGSGSLNFCSTYGDVQRYYTRQKGTATTCKLILAGPDPSHGYTCEIVTAGTCAVEYDFVSDTGCIAQDDPIGP